MGKQEASHIPGPLSVREIFLNTPATSTATIADLTSDASGNLYLNGVLVATSSGGEEWKNLLGKPFVTVSPIGLSTSGVTVANNGADFGPDTAGTTTSGILEAINNFATTGGVIFLLHGVFSSAYILIQPDNGSNSFSGITIIGSGMDETIIRLNTALGGVLGLGNSATYIQINDFTIANLTLDGNNNIPATSAIFGTNGVLNFTADHVKFINNGPGSQCYNAFMGAGSRGGVTTNVRFKACQFIRQQNGDDMLGGSVTANWWIEDCIWDDGGFTGEGIGLGPTGGLQVNIHITGNTFQNTKTATGFNGNAIHLEGAGSDVIITGNYISSGSNDGIDILPNTVAMQYSRVIIANNTIDGTPGYTNSTSPIWLRLNQIDGLVIANNTFNYAAGQGIELFDVANVVISGNYLKDANYLNGTFTTTGSVSHSNSAIAVLYDSNLVTPQKEITITGNQIVNITTAYGNGIVVDNAYSNLTVTGNDVATTVSDKIYGPASTYVSNNLGFGIQLDTFGNIILPSSGTSPSGSLGWISYSSGFGINVNAGNTTGTLLAVQKNNNVNWAIGNVGTITKYNAANTAGMGVSAIYASYASGLKTNAAIAAHTLTTPPAAAGTYRLHCTVYVTTGTTMAMTVNITYTDFLGTPHTADLVPLNTGSTGVPLASSTIIAAGTYYGVPMEFEINNSQTAITIATVGTTTTCAYYLNATLEQLA